MCGVHLYMKIQYEMAEMEFSLRLWNVYIDENTYTGCLKSFDTAEV